MPANPKAQSIIGSPLENALKPRAARLNPTLVPFRVQVQLTSTISSTTQKMIPPTPPLPPHPNGVKAIYPYQNNVHGA